MPESKLKEYAEGKEILSANIKTLEEVTAKIQKMKNLIDNLVLQGNKHDFINAYLCGAMEAGKISRVEKDSMYDDLMKIQEGKR